MRTWDVLDEKERTMDVIKGYVEVNDDVENDVKRINLPCHKRTILSVSESEM